jgi:hypothetical protein
MEKNPSPTHLSDVVVIVFVLIGILLVIADVSSNVVATLQESNPGTTQTTPVNAKPTGTMPVGGTTVPAGATPAVRPSIDPGPAPEFNLPGEG